MIIGVLDSGIGGTSIFHGLQKALPHHTYIYQSDPSNFPYSTKTQTELKKIAEEQISQLISKGAQLIVVACNTLTVSALAHLRQTFPSITFVGTVPAIKKAADTLPTDSTIVVLATAHTAQSSYLAQLIENHSQGQEFIVLGTTELVKAVEENDHEVAQIVLTHLLSNLAQEKHIDAIVIGCTHFSLVEKKIRSAISYPIQIFDSVDGIINQVKKLTTSS